MNTPGWAQFFLDATGSSKNDTTEEERKIKSLMEKRGFSKSKAIAILKANGGIKKNFGNDETNLEDGKKKKKKKRRRSNY